MAKATSILKSISSLTCIVERQPMKLESYRDQCGQEYETAPQYIYIVGTLFELARIERTQPRQTDGREAGIKWHYEAKESVEVPRA